MISFWFEMNGWLVLGLGMLGTAAGRRGRLLATPRKTPEHLVLITAGIDPRPVLTSYLGVVLAGAMFLALGLFVSSW